MQTVVIAPFHIIRQQDGANIVIKFGTLAYESNNNGILGLLLIFSLRTKKELLNHSGFAHSVHLRSESK